MLDQDMTPEDLSPELDRVHVDLYEALRQLANYNTPYEPPILPGEPVTAEVPVALFASVLRSLPDAAGTGAFVQAVISAWGPPPVPPPSSAGA
jgi:hypothetical protein